MFATHCRNIRVFFCFATLPALGSGCCQFPGRDKALYDITQAESDMTAHFRTHFSKKWSTQRERMHIFSFGGIHWQTGHILLLVNIAKVNFAQYGTFKVNVHPDSWRRTDSAVFSLSLYFFFLEHFHNLPAQYEQPQRHKIQMMLWR